MTCKGADQGLVSETCLCCAARSRRDLPSCMGMGSAEPATVTVPAHSSQNAMSFQTW